ncbi:MAG: zinc-binding dehydrogenase, partial [Halanaerobiaceae bacterium]
RAEVGFGDDVLIFGAGPLGLLHLQLVNHAGAARVIICDLIEEKLELARELGAADTVNVEKRNTDTLKEIAPYGFDMVIDATGVAQVVEDAVSFVKNTGKLMFFGVCPQDFSIEVNPYEVYRRDLELIGVFALNKTLGESIKLIDNGVINTEKLISDVMPLQDLGKALNMLKNGKAGGKIQIEPWR